MSDDNMSNNQHPLTPDHVDPDNLRITDDLYHQGRCAFTEGKSILANPEPIPGDWSRAWAAGWFDALADQLRGSDCSRDAYKILLRKDRAHIF